MKIGDKLFHFGHSDRYFTEGTIYEVSYVGRNDISVIDNTGGNHILTNEFVPECFEVISTELIDKGAIK